MSELDQYGTGIRGTRSGTEFSDTRLKPECRCPALPKYHTAGQFRRIYFCIPRQLAKGGLKKIGIHPVTEVYKEKYAAKRLAQKVLILPK
jgi:hypothetical protein